MKNWIRRMQVILTKPHTNNSLVFDSNDMYDLVITGNKNMSLLIDKCIIQIKNLTYDVICRIIDGGYYQVTVKIGYDNTLFTFYSGYLYYISNDRQDRANSTCYILCTSKLLAVYGQSKLNLSIKSGVNMYAALQFLCKKAGITKLNIDEQFKNRIIKQSINSTNNIQSVLDTFLNSNGYAGMTDASNYNNVVSIWDTYNKNLRTIRLKPSDIIFNSYPSLTTDGVNITLAPTLNYMPGDVLEIDNSLLNFSAKSVDDVSKYVQFYMNTSTNSQYGQYIIYQISYNLQSRGRAYELNCLCKSKDLLAKLYKNNSKSSSSYLNSTVAKEV